MNKKIILAFLSVLVVGLALWAMGAKNRNVSVDTFETATTTQEFATSTAPTTNGNKNVPPLNSGITGLVTVGPTCPNVQNPPIGTCDDKALSTQITVYRTNNLNTPISSFKSDSTGRFKINLAPGNYVVRAGVNPYPSCPDSQVVVSNSTYASIQIKCDSGIR